MTNSKAVRVTFTCVHCGSVNELTAAHLHEGTMIHCSRCSSSVAPLGLLDKRNEPNASTASAS